MEFGLLLLLAGEVTTDGEKVLTKERATSFFDDGGQFFQDPKDRRAAVQNGEISAPSTTDGNIDPAASNAELGRSKSVFALPFR